MERPALRGHTRKTCHMPLLDRAEPPAMGFCDDPWESCISHFGYTNLLIGGHGYPPIRLCLCSPIIAAEDTRLQKVQHSLYVFTSTYVFCLGMVFPPVRV